jgi:acetoin utilization protein AcuC
MSTPQTTQDACAFVYAPQLSSYRLSETHPFKPLRLELTRSLLQSCDLLSAEHEVAPKPFAEAQLLALHDPDFVAAVKAVSQGDPVENAAHYGLGTPDNPIFAGMHETAMSVCGASLTALRRVASGEATRTAAFSGGLHHAGRARMSGFCTYNDVALAVHEAVSRYGLRVAYLDLDAHHGDGVQDFFYESAEVLTLSVHESGQYLFPGTGFIYEVGRGAGRGLSVNLPLEPFTEDASYLEVLHTLLPRALEAFRPDLIVLQAGADMHHHDPLSHLHLSVQGIAESYRLVSALADRFCNGRLVVTGGGGYDPYRTVPRLWALLWSVLSRQSAPSRVPDVWRSEWEEQLGVALPETFADPVAAWPENPRREQVAAANRLTADKLLATLEPIWEERFGR